MKILFSRVFEKNYKKLPRDIQRLADLKLLVFMKDAFDPRLRTHQLHGRFRGLYSFSLNYKYRVVFEKQKEGIFVLIAIGMHDIYDR